MGGNSPDTNREGALRPILAVIALSCTLLTAGCADLVHKPAATTNENTAAGVASLETSAPVQEEARDSANGEKEPATAVAPAPAEEKPAVVTEAVPASPVAKSVTPAAKPSTPPPASATPAPKAAPELATEQPSPPLDLKLLEKRLKETSAIGIFTKLALKNQVDDLLDNFRAYYQGRTNASLSQLRQPYEMLIMKALAILQDRDPGLARDILESREAIWKVLTDREKFAQHSL